MKSSKKIKIRKYILGNIEEIEDEVVVENPVNVYINNKFYITLLCTPDEEKELIVGFLFSEGVIEKYSDIKELQMKEQYGGFVLLKEDHIFLGKHQRAITSGCGQGSIPVEVLIQKNIGRMRVEEKFEIDGIARYMKEFMSLSPLFQATGGVHSASLCSVKGIEFSSEDIGRHNAVDKIIGKCLIEEIEMKDKILLVTGRISSDLLLKTARAGIPIIVSHSAATELAIQIGRSINMTVIGFARGSKMNIYNGFDRLIL